MEHPLTSASQAHRITGLHHCLIKGWGWEMPSKHLSIPTEGMEVFKITVEEFTQPSFSSTLVLSGFYLLTVLGFSMWPA